MTTVQAPTGAALPTTWQNAPTQTINAGGVAFAYRQLGPSAGVPVVFLTHLAAVLDNWDPRVVDGIAAKHRVITFDNRGVGASSGATPTTIEEMASDAVTFIHALGFDQVDLFGALHGRHDRPGDRAAAAATGAQDDHRRNRPGGGRRHRQGHPRHLPRHRARTADPPGPQAVPLLHQDPERAPGRQGVPRAAQGADERPRQGHLRPLLPRPAQAIHRWGQQKPANLASIHQPVLVVNGESDKMVPTTNSVDLDRRLPNSQLVVYPDAGHGGVFQFHEDFVKRTLEFL